MKNKIIFKTLMLKGEAGSTIVSMEKTGHVGTADIYTITFNDGSTTEISLENMSAITSVEMTSSTDTEDIYTITCADGSTQTFSVLNHNADIAAMSDDIDTIDARVDNFINSVVPNTVETLWTGSISKKNDSATLSKAVSNFDYIDLYLIGSADSKYIRVPASQSSVDIQQQNMSDDASSNFLRLWEMGVSISGTTVSITKVIAWAWDDPNNSNPTVTADAQNAIPITRIDGVKIASASPAELTDIRVGADGITYNSAGDAARGQYNGLNNSLNTIIKTVESMLTLSDWETGYITTSGTVDTNTACQYTSLSITSDLIGKKIYVDGSAWWSVKPYVFVGNTIVYPDIPSTGGTITQYTDLVFLPTETGTLYINKYDSGNTHNIGKAYVLEIESVKSSMLPQPLPVKDVTAYSPVELTMIQYKLLNGWTGAITDSDNLNYYVTDYTAVTPNSKVMITTSHFWGSGMWAFYDTNKQFISGRYAGSGSTPTTVYCEIVSVPSNAEYIVIGLLNQAKFHNCYLWQGAIVNALPSQKWNGKKWTLIGDSLTDHNTRAEKHYYDFIAGATGISLVNLAVSGTGYAKGVNTFAVQANSIPSDSDVVTLFGSFNDLSSGLDIGTVTDTGTSTIAGCINTTLDNIQAIIPLANIGVIAPTPWHTTQPSTSGNAYNYVEMIKAICEKRSIPFLDLWRNSNLRPWDSDFLEYAYSNDDGGGVHPDSNGHALIAPRIKAFLETLLL